MRELRDCRLNGMHDNLCGHRYATALYGIDLSL